jgi:RNA polymerase sigma-70 factor (ECF subfamily)
MTETATQLTQGLLDRAGQGDADARRELLERYRVYLRRMVAARLDRRLVPRVDASDIVQETLADAARRLDDYLVTRPLPFFGWLRKLAGEQVIQAHRKHMLAQRRSVSRESRMPELSNDSAIEFARSFVAHDTSPSNRLLHQERDEQVMATLAALPDRDREVLVMRHFEHLTTAEIADALGITEGAVEGRLLRAVQRLRIRLEGLV